jgi:hypothetical protein
VKKANLLKEWDAKPPARYLWVAGLPNDWINSTLKPVLSLRERVFIYSGSSRGRAMSLTVNNQIQNLDFFKKHMELRESAKEDKTTGATQNRNFDMSGDLKDIVEVQNFQQEAESGRVSSETDDKNADEVKKLLNFAIKLLSSENDKSRLEKIYGFRQEKIVKLLSVHP